MTVAELWVIFKGIGAAIGIIITLITFIGLVSKRPRAALRKLIKEEADNANKDLKEQIKSQGERMDLKLKGLEKRLGVVEANDVAQIRNTITHIYFKYKDQKTIPHYEKENVMYLYARYEALGGNSYVRGIVKEMESWEENI